VSRLRRVRKTTLGGNWLFRVIDGDNLPVLE